MKDQLKNIGIWLICGLACASATMAIVHIVYRVQPQKEEAQQFPPEFSVGDASLIAEAAVVYDPASGRILYAKNPEMQLPLASLTKLMSADVALSSFSATSSVIISPQAIQTEGDSGLKVGERWQLGDLVRYALLVSSNDAVAAVADSVGDVSFVSKMNDRAKELSLSQSYFLDSTGLDLTSTVSGAYGSALDVSKLAAAFFAKHPSYFESTVSEQASEDVSGSGAPVHATAAPIMDIPGLIGAKTGYTDLAGGNLVTAFELTLGHPVIAAVLHSTEEGRFSDMRTLIEAARQAATPKERSLSALTIQ